MGERLHSAAPNAAVPIGILRKVLLVIVSPEAQYCL